MTSHELDREIKELEDAIQFASGGQAAWKEILGAIRQIGVDVKGVRYPSRDAHQEAWIKFQSLVAQVKAQQQEVFSENAARAELSAAHLSKIEGYAEQVEWNSEFEENLLGLATVGLYDLLKAGWKAVAGPYDEIRIGLQERSEVLKKAWKYLSDHKGEMRGSDKSIAHARLERAKAKLDLLGHNGESNNSGPTKPDRPIGRPRTPSSKLAERSGGLANWLS